MIFFVALFDLTIFYINKIALSTVIKVKLNCLLYLIIIKSPLRKMMSFWSEAFSARLTKTSEILPKFDSTSE
ncbi:hypothetical protein BpHYR1_054650 [Brachionus plicatilis]|uniref:Uncharacterized protein n=1 Tax=Brachionus plicatilis TaxID=10195 RepID=A0A3M7R1T4_BRAPC|nr:hypothetical protein BpHYR1_054650 [Brachionus plicatilis]